jgi:hypothetical protein
MLKKIFHFVLMTIFLFQCSGNSEEVKFSKNQKFLTVRECINNCRQGNTVFLIGDLNDASQYIIDLYKNIHGIKGNIETVDKVKKHVLKENNIIAIGVPQEHYFIKRCVDLLPIKFDRQSVTIQNTKYIADDLCILFSMPNPFNTEKHCIVSTTNNPSSYSPLALVRNHGFFINRKSDGRIYEQDNLAVGNFKIENGKIEIDTVKIYKKEPKKLNKLSTEGVTIYYNGVTKEDASKVLNFISAMREAIIDFGIEYKQTITVYLYKEYSDRIKSTSYTDAVNTIWSKFESPEEFYSEDRGQIAILAHEMARLAFQPWLTDRKKIGPLLHVANDWSHYFQYTYIVPYVWEKLGAEGWPCPYDYNAEFGLSEFKALYQGCANTYAQILYEIEHKYGRKIIAETVNGATNNGQYTYTSFEDFMVTLAQKTNDEELIKNTLEAYPTPMENTYRRRIFPIGITPTLDDIIFNNDFIIQKVEANSSADLAGLKVDDEIIEFNGHDVKTEKDFAHRKGLQAWRDDGYFLFQVKRKNKIHEISIKINSR